MNLTDGIFSWGNNEEEHLKNLHAVLSRLSSSGLTLNECKIELKRTELIFRLTFFSRYIISIQAGKSDAILIATPPRRQKKSLSLASYCSRFNKTLLQELTKKNKRNDNVKKII